MIAANYNDTGLMRVSEAGITDYFLVLEKPETNRWYKIVFSAAFESAGARSGAHLVLVSNPGKTCTLRRVKNPFPALHVQAFYWDHRYFVSRMHSDDLN